MTEEMFRTRISFILTREELGHIKSFTDEGVYPKVTIDLHEMKRQEAYKLTKNIIALFTCPFDLDIIHGYNGGTVLKKMVQEEIHNKRIKHVKKVKYNEGETILQISA